jgi:hypothetical protein
MIEIGRTILSLDLFLEQFECDLKECRGACCVEGDSGAPLTETEAEAIERDYPVFVQFLPERHREEISKQGFAVTDSDGDLVTPLVENRQCAYSFNDDEGILKCAIEKSYFEGKSGFRKPVSCHLFPVRISEYRHFDAVNYQRIAICHAGRVCGHRNNMPLYLFLKEPLIRKYGEEWYNELEKLAKNKTFLRKIRSGHR